MIKLRVWYPGVLPRPTSAVVRMMPNDGDSLLLEWVSLTKLVEEDVEYELTLKRCPKRSKRRAIK